MAYQAHSEAQFASLREQIATLAKQLSVGSGQDRRRRIPLSHELEEEDTHMEDEDGNPLRGAECTDINPLFKLRPIGRNPVSNSIF
jgi:hypothetical protein